MPVPYNEAYGVLADVYLEDSFVLAFGNSDSTLWFDLELVLCERHAAYLGPKPGEHYDFRRARLDVSAARIECEWSGHPPSVDPGGEIDYGNIDSWLVDEDGWDELTGDWGKARLFRSAVTLTITEQRKR